MKEEAREIASFGEDNDLTKVRPNLQPIRNETQKMLYQDLFTDEDLKYLKFKVSVRRQKKGKVGKKKSISIPFSEFDFETDSLVPRLDITKHIEVLGDYFDLDTDQTRTISTFEIYVDYHKLIMTAYEDVKEHFDKLGNEPNVREFEDYTCEEFETDEFTPIIELTDDEKEQIKKDVEEEAASKLADFMDQFDRIDYDSYLKIEAERERLDKWIKEETRKQIYDESIEEEK